MQIKEVYNNPVNGEVTIEYEDDSVISSLQPFIVRDVSGSPIGLVDPITLEDITFTDGLVQTSDNRKFKLVSGVIRNLNDGNGWGLILNSTHSSCNVDSVTNDTSSISVNYTSIGASKVVSFLATTDETLARAGFFVGASVGVNGAQIQLKQRRLVSDYVSYNGTNWVSSNGVFTFNFSAGTLTLTHETVETTTSGVSCSVTGRDGVLVPQAGLASGTTTQLRWYDWAGVLQTTENTNMKAYVNRGFASSAANPSLVHEGTFPSGNIWFIGLFELNS